MKQRWSLSTDAKRLVTAVPPLLLPLPALRTIVRWSPIVNEAPLCTSTQVIPREDESQRIVPDGVVNAAPIGIEGPPVSLSCSPVVWMISPPAFSCTP